MSKQKKIRRYQYSIGSKEARLELIEFVPSLIKRRHPRGLFLCDCGSQKIARLHSVFIEKTIKSCGCLNLEQKKKSETKRKKHGMHLSDEYRIYSSIKKRCYGKNYREYPRYGGRGILMSDEWLFSFENFYKDMGPRPSKSHSVDRINNNMGYSKENCRWATDKEQANNRHNTPRFFINGKTYTIPEAIAHFGSTVNRNTIDSRVFNGWDILDALLTPAWGKRTNGLRDKE